MFHAFDKAQREQPLSRPDWMALLARAPLDLLEARLGARGHSPARWLRAPETGLMMVQGRAGGTGERFNLGEITVTRCALRLRDAPPQAPVGVAYVLGPSHRQAQLAALADALLQDPAQHAQWQAQLLQPVREHLAQQRWQRLQRVHSTRVEFFTVAREADSASGDDEENA